MAYRHDRLKDKCDTASTHFQCVQVAVMGNPECCDTVAPFFEDVTPDRVLSLLKERDMLLAALEGFILDEVPKGKVLLGFGEEVRKARVAVAIAKGEKFYVG